MDVTAVDSVTYRVFADRQYRAEQQYAYKGERSLLCAEILYGRNAKLVFKFAHTCT